MSKRLVAFNHKGGVSKTTTVYTIGWMLAKNARVLLVDADSQCNLTSLILKDRFDAHYLDDATKLDNFKDALSPAFKGMARPVEGVTCVTADRNQSLYLLPGHPNLSEYEANLSFAQTASGTLTTLQNLPGAMSDVIRQTEERYGIDYTIIDLNPGLSAINQNLFLASDGFLVPTNPDPFSVMALNSLAAFLPRWTEWKKNNRAAFDESAYPLRDSIP